MAFLLLLVDVFDVLSGSPAAVSHPSHGPRWLTLTLTSRRSRGGAAVGRRDGGLLPKPHPYSKTRTKPLPPRKFGQQRSVVVGGAAAAAPAAIAIPAGAAVTAAVEDASRWPLLTTRAELPLLPLLLLMIMSLPLFLLHVQLSHHAIRDPPRW